MNKYEIMYILKANLEESARQAVVEGLQRHHYCWKWYNRQR